MPLFKVELTIISTKYQFEIRMWGENNSQSNMVWSSKPKPLVNYIPKQENPAFLNNLQRSNTNFNRFQTKPVKYHQKMNKNHLWGTPQTWSIDWTKKQSGQSQPQSNQRSEDWCQNQNSIQPQHWGSPSLWNSNWGPKDNPYNALFWGSSPHVNNNQQGSFGNNNNTSYYKTRNYGNRGKDQQLQPTNNYSSHDLSSSLQPAEKSSESEGGYDKKVCKICYAAKSEMINVNCHHMMMCQNCLSQYRVKQGYSRSPPCPVCKTVGDYIKYIVPIYL